MTESEQTIVDAKGQFAQAVRDGHRLDDADWITGRVLLSNERLVLVYQNGKRTIPVPSIVDIGGRYDVNQSIARVSDYVSLRVEDDIILVTTDDGESFEDPLYSVLLDGEFLLVRHPAVKGGVVTDVEWEKTRVKTGDDAINLETANGSFIEVDLDDIGRVEGAERTVRGETRRIVEVEHSLEDTSVETHFAGPHRHVGFLESLFAEGESRSEASIDLDESDREVLMALYSGVSPFEIPDFTGHDVDEIEETFERLIELDVLDEVRKRREVTLTARGRNLASESINEK